MLTPLSAEAIVLPFYRLALTVNDTTTPAAVLSEVLADDFVSITSQQTKDRAALIGQLTAFWRLIPDLRWEVRDVVAAGTCWDRVAECPAIRCWSAEVNMPRLLSAAAA
jgi:hypothetical protein